MKDSDISSKRVNRSVGRSGGWKTLHVLGQGKNRGFKVWVFHLNFRTGNSSTKNKIGYGFGNALGRAIVWQCFGIGGPNQFIKMSNAYNLGHLQSSKCTNIQARPISIMF